MPRDHGDDEDGESFGRGEERREEKRRGEREEE